MRLLNFQNLRKRLVALMSRARQRKARPKPGPTLRARPSLQSQQRKHSLCLMESHSQAKIGVPL
jgi:hypothetical protein